MEAAEKRLKVFSAGSSSGTVTCRICGAAVSLLAGTSAADLHVRHHEAMADAFRLLQSNEGRSTPRAVFGEAVEAHELEG